MPISLYIGIVILVSILYTYIYIYYYSDEFNSDEFMYAYPIVVLRIDLIKQVYFYKYNNFFISINIII